MTVAASRLWHDDLLTSLVRIVAGAEQMSDPGRLSLLDLIALVFAFQDVVVGTVELDNGFGAHLVVADTRVVYV